MNYVNYFLWDLETTGVNTDTAQIVQIGGLAADNRTLSVKAGSEFNCLAKPLYGEEAAAANVEELGDGAIKVHGKTHEILETAPSAESTVKNFVEHIAKYNPKGTAWFKPISVTYNGIGYDTPILKRYLDEYNLDWPFHKIYKVDMMDHMYTLFENDKEVSKISLDNLVRGYMGYNDTEHGAHDALGDVYLLHTLFNRYMKLVRKMSRKTEFKDSMA
jgi:DNA polymerase III epsilon subunit-like protein